MQSNRESSCTTSRLRIGMGTFISIEAQAHTQRRARIGVEAAFSAIEQVEKLMHPTRCGSDLAAIRQAAAGTSVPVHAWTWDVLMLCKRLNHASRGIFDPCLPEAAGRFGDLEFSATRRVIAHAPLCIDLGGIAKGFAVDRALMALRQAGCHSGLANAGGDLAVFGARSHTILRRGVDGRCRILEIRNAALATSDAAAPSPPVEHRGHYNGADRSAIVSGTVSIGAASAAIADGLTKCVLAGGDAAASDALLGRFGAYKTFQSGMLRDSNAFRKKQLDSVVML